MAAVECGALLGKHAPNNCGGFFQHVEPGANRWEVIAKRGRFLDVPAGTQPQLESAVGYMIQGCGRLGDTGRVPVTDVQHHDANSGVPGFRSQGTEGRHGFKMVDGTAGRWCLVEVVPG